jgi:hypothetical protein
MLEDLGMISMDSKGRESGLAGAGEPALILPSMMTLLRTKLLVSVGFIGAFALSVSLYKRQLPSSL